jgi:hypothetical protein
VEVVEAGGDPIPQGRIDLSSPDVVTWYNLASFPFSNLFPSPIEVDGALYPTVEHCLVGKRFGPEALELEAVKAASVEAIGAVAMALASEQAGWVAVREEALLAALTAKFTQHSALRAELMATGSKSLVLVDADQWGGMSASGGIPTGKNRVGKCLEAVRAGMVGPSSF